MFVLSVHVYFPENKTEWFCECQGDVNTAFENCQFEKAYPPSDSRDITHHTHIPCNYPWVFSCNWFDKSKESEAL